MTVVEAKVLDSTHLELANPINMPAGRIILVSVSDDLDERVERQEWLALSAEGLKGAYGDGEPEYTKEMVREINTDYEE